MVTPGLHELDCKNCGAPLDPPERSEVVRCPHCGQPHLWVAPSAGDQGRFVRRDAPSRDLARPLSVLFVAGVVLLVGMVVASGVAGYVLWDGRSSGAAPAAVVPADAPIELGDELTYQYSENASCASYVEHLEASGEIVLAGCSEAAPAKAPRSMLRFDTYAYREPSSGDVALRRGARGWERLVVVGAGGGDRVRVEPLLGGAERGVEKSSLFVVRNGPATYRLVQPPPGAPLEVGDGVHYRAGARIDTGKLSELAADTVLVEPGSFTPEGGFEPSKAAPVKVARDGLRLELGNPASAPPRGALLLTKRDERLRRARFDYESDLARWHVAGVHGGDEWVVWAGNALRIPGASAADGTDAGIADDADTGAAE